MTDDSELLSALQLNLIPGLGPRMQHLLCSRFGSPEGVFQAPFDQLRQVAGMGSKLAGEIREHRDLKEAEEEYVRCREAGIELVLRSSTKYPRRLAEICDAPHVLYSRGGLNPGDALAVAIVGSRRCTLYGRQQAERLAKSLASAGMTIVSGLARGIDAAAHRGALAAGGRTIAVAATGLATVYPPEHDDLAEEIVEQGAVVSESRLDRQPKPGLFPQRNRIISGLSLGVIIIEAGRKSGALHTAKHAMEQGREVLVVPGRIDSAASGGCHELIRDGASLVRGADDVLEELGPLAEPVVSAGEVEIHVPRELKLNEVERELLAHIGSEAKHVDEVVQASRLETSRVLSTLTVLEMKRAIRRLPGGYVVRGAG